MFEGFPKNLKEALGESEDADKNYKELLAMSDEEIEKAIQETFEAIEKGLPAEAEKQCLDFKAMVESWSPVDAGFNLLFLTTKETFLMLFASYPNLMAKTIQAASEVFIHLPPIYLRFAKRWEEERKNYV